MRKLKKMKQTETTINIRIFTETEICVRESEVMATGSERGSSVDWIYDRTIICDYQLINVKGMTTNLNRKTTVVVVLGVAAVTITVLLLFIFLLELSN